MLGVAFWFYSDQRLNRNPSSLKGDCLCSSSKLKQQKGWKPNGWLSLLRTDEKGNKQDRPLVSRKDSLDDLCRGKPRFLDETRKKEAEGRKWTIWGDGKFRKCGLQNYPDEFSSFQSMRA